jgi:acyl-CoA dehydrogenase
MSSTDNTVLHQELKSAVAELCRNFPDSYWRELDSRRAYPEALVQALTKAGYMAT